MLTADLSVWLTKGKPESSFVSDSTESINVLSHITHHSHRQCSLVLSDVFPSGSTERIQYDGVFGGKSTPLLFLDVSRELQIYGDSNDFYCQTQSDK